MEKTIFTNMCMVYSGSRVLLIDRKKADWPGITFPGGHVEPGESFTDAVIREVREETGLTICAPRLCGVKDWVREDGSRYVVLFYRTDAFRGALRPSPEGRVFWAELEEMKQMALAPDMENMLRVFLEDDLSEFFYFREGDRWTYALK